MTWKLVGTMVLCLTICLALFALLVSYYQADVMKGIEGTVKEVGKRTAESVPSTKALRSLRKVVTIDIGPDGVARTESFVATDAPVIRRSVDVAGVTIEREDGERLVLRLPTVVSSATGPTPAGESLVPVSVQPFEDLHRKMLRRTVAVFLAVMAAGVVMAGILARKVTGPIRRLDRAMALAASGDLSARVEGGGQDEIGRLSSGFNGMAASLALARQRERDLLLREKLTSLGRLAAGVAHDVRNPLHSMMLELDHLEDVGASIESSTKEEFERTAEMIRGEIKRLDRLVEGFLSFARASRRSREHVNLPELLESVRSLVDREAARRSTRLVVETEPGLPPILVDSEGMKAALMNLLLNAFEAIGESGECRLGCRLVDPGTVLVTIADDGCGMSAKVRERATEFAFSTREGGTGLGLAMVRQLVEAHGGRIEIESEPFRGTTVSLFLPTREGAA